MFRSWLVCAVLVLASGLSTTASAQRDVAFGVLGGGAIAKFGGNDARNAELSKSRTGLAVGAFASLQVGPNLRVEPGILYAQKGARSSQSGDNGTFKMDYLSVPVLLKLRFPAGDNSRRVTPNVYAGAAAGIKVGCKLSGTFDGDDVSQSCEEAGAQVKSSDMGIIIGGGMEIGRALVDVRYEMGLPLIDSRSDPDDTKNRALFLLVGWMFRSPR